MSTPKNDGGPAFPAHHPSVECKGMTLRDWFAGQALAGLLAHPDTRLDRERFAEAMREGPWEIADAMLAAREGKQ